MKITILSVSILLFFAISGYAQTCTRHIEPTGRFSYCPPAGWESKPSPNGGPYKKFISPEGVAPVANINVKDEVTLVSHNDYLATAMQALLKENALKPGASVKIIEWTSFTTDSKIRGSRMVYEMLQDGIQIFVIQFILDLRGKKLIFTGGTTQDSRGDVEPLITAAAKSIKTF